jgi:hypothetical protein
MSTASTARRGLGVLAVILAAGFAALGVAAIVSGGFEVTWAGWPIRVRDPQRPLLLAGLAIGGFAWAYGSDRSWIALRRVFARLDERLLVAAFAAGPVIFGLPRGSIAGSASGAALVLATYVLGRNFGSSRMGLVAAWLIATSPTVFSAETSAFIDVAAAAAWALAWLLLLRETTMMTAAAGGAASVAMLSRSELAPMAGLMLLWIVWQAQAGGADQPRAFRRAVCFSAVAVQGAVIAGALNFDRRGSALAFDGSDLALAAFAPGARAYARAFADLYTVLPVLGAAALFVPWRRVWPGAGDCRLAVIAGLTVLVVIGEGCLQTSWPTWEGLRFFLPAWPFLTIGCAAVARYAVRSGPPAVKILVVWLIVWTGLRALLAGLGRGAFG